MQPWKFSKIFNTYFASHRAVAVLETTCDPPPPPSYFTPPPSPTPAQHSTGCSLCNSHLREVHALSRESQEQGAAEDSMRVGSKNVVPLRIQLCCFNNLRRVKTRSVPPYCKPAPHEGFITVPEGLSVSSRRYWCQQCQLKRTLSVLSMS